MIARIAVWEPMPDDHRQWVLDAAKAARVSETLTTWWTPTLATACRSCAGGPRTTGTTGGSVPALKACAGQSLRFR